MRGAERLWSRLARFRSAPPRWPEARAPQTHVVLLDGTASTLTRGRETNIGLTYRLLSEMGPEAGMTLYYEPGIQWRGWTHTLEVVAGIGIDRQIRRAYLFLARNYRPGDRIFLMGFSRGAYAVRSLAGLIDRMGLLRPAQISEETLDRVYDLYRADPFGPRATAMKAALCHDKVDIAFVGVFDTVRALGLRWPVLWRFAGTTHPYHNHALGPSTRIGRHALAMHETRDAFAPVLWEVPEERVGDVVQMWFRGTHGDVGGQLNGRNFARPLSNIPFVWMLGEAEAAGLKLPLYWRNRYLTDKNTPSIGTMVGWGKLFLARHRRRIGLDPSEMVHPSARPAAERAGLDIPIGLPPQPGT
ncbi:DUF2235 domain-containing protein [Rhodobacterales bacterium HKCCE2091]|nr:DUF2235 domain-containing protein [Rhodobacterales bacterium HKCCE2091]